MAISRGLRKKIAIVWSSWRYKRAVKLNAVAETIDMVRMICAFGALAFSASKYGLGL
ncbi:MAG: hypothetical protein DHS20C07_04530 [Methyloligella sp.]|nr:MAG: hypothetical protein DHS20C07_04530 [Methyloligella sp.]